MKRKISIIACLGAWLLFFTFIPVAFRWLGHANGQVRQEERIRDLNVNEIQEPETGCKYQFVNKEKVQYTRGTFPKLTRVVLAVDSGIRTIRPQEEYD